MGWEGTQNALQPNLSGKQDRRVVSCLDLGELSYSFPKAAMFQSPLQRRVCVLSMDWIRTGESRGGWVTDCVSKKRKVVDGLVLSVASQNCFTFTKN